MQQKDIKSTKCPVLNENFRKDKVVTDIQGNTPDLEVLVSYFWKGGQTPEITGVICNKYDPIDNICKINNLKCLYLQGFKP